MVAVHAVGEDGVDMRHRGVGDGEHLHRALRQAQRLGRHVGQHIRPGEAAAEHEHSGLVDQAAVDEQRAPGGRCVAGDVARSEPERQQRHEHSDEAGEGTGGAGHAVD